MPREVSLTWDPFPIATTALPATMIDPESVEAVTLSVAEPGLTWENVLVEDPIPTVAAVAVEPLRIPVPLLSLPLLAAAVMVMILGFRRRRGEAAIATTRVVLALALVVGPLARTTMALPASASGAPSERQARRILAGLLPNIYRAMEWSWKSAAAPRHGWKRSRSWTRERSNDRRPDSASARPGRWEGW
jgi:hypothetical protein